MPFLAIIKRCPKFLKCPVNLNLKAKQNYFDILTKSTNFFEKYENYLFQINEIIVMAIVNVLLNKNNSLVFEQGEAATLFDVFFRINSAFTQTM